MTTYLATGQFWQGAGERAVRAFAWAFIAALGVPVLDGAVTPGGFDVLNVGWVTALSYGAGAAVLSLVFSVAVGQLGGPPGSPSLVDDRPDPADLE
jgi:hypothetical protein